MPPRKGATVQREWTECEEKKLRDGHYRLNHGIPPFYKTWKWNDIAYYIGPIEHEGQSMYRSGASCGSYYRRNKERFERVDPDELATVNFILPRMLRDYENFYNVQGMEAVLEEHQSFLEERESEDVSNMQDITRPVSSERLPRFERTPERHQDVVNAVFRMVASGWIWEDVFWHLKAHQKFDGISLRSLKDWWYRNKGPNDLFSKLQADPRATEGVIPPRLQNLSEQEERNETFDGEMVKAANVLMECSEAEIESMSWETQEDPYNPIDPLDPLDPANLYMTGVSQNTIAERDSLKRLGSD